MGWLSDAFDWVGDVFSEVVDWFIDIPDVPEYEDKSQGTLLNKQSNLAQIPVIYGQRKVGGTRVFVETSGTDNEYLYICLVLCEGEIDAIGDVYINDTISTDTKFASLVSIDKKLGTDDQTASSVLTAAPSWTSDHRLRGIAYLGLRFKWDRDVFGSIPDVTAVVRGKKCDIPWDGETNQYTTNPVVCLYDYLTNTRYGKGLPSSVFDDGNLESWETAANICSANVPAYTDGADINIFDCNVVLDVSKPIIENVKILLSGMQGMLNFSQGIYRVIVETQGSATYAFTEDNILSGITVNGEKKRDRFNRVIATYANPDKNWQQDQIEYPEAGSSEYTTLLNEDGGVELERRVSLDTITSKYQARNIAYTILKKSRGNIRCSFVATIDALQVMVGDIVSVTHQSFGWSAKPFRVMGLNLQADGNVGVSLMEHQDNVYSWLEGDEIPEFPDTTLPDPFSVAAVNAATITVTSDEAISDNGNAVQRFLIDWTEPSDNFISEYVVQYKESTSSSWDNEVRIDAPPVIAADIKSGTAYNVRVKAENSLGVSSAWSTVASATTAADLTSRSGAKTFYQDAAPTSGIQAGDLWYDTNDDNKPYRYSGSAWVTVRDAQIADAISAASDAQATADGKVTTFYQNDAPTAEGTGDLWIDTNDGNKLYRWSGSAWTEVQDDAIATALGDAANAQATADGKIESFYQTSAPSAGAVGDLWFDTDDDNKAYRWNGSSWQTVRDGTIADAISAAATAQATADGKVTTFYQNDAPTAEGVGDLWVDTNDGNKLYRWSGSAWTSVQDSDIASALSAASTAQSTADGKIVSFYQASAPTAEGVGDIWFDTDADNKVYRWSGSSWVAQSGNLFGLDEVTKDEINVVKLSDINVDMGSITAGSLNIGSGKFVVATDGTATITNATTGARLEIKNNVIKVYDASNVVRVQIGDLS